MNFREVCNPFLALLAVVLCVALLPRPTTADETPAPAKNKEAVADKAKDGKPDKGDKSEKPGEPAKPATVKLQKGPLKVEVALDGVFEAQRMTEIVLRPQEWSGLVVVSAVPHGKSVKRGDLLVALETEKIDRAIADLRTELQLSALALKQAEQELRVLETATPLDLSMAERAHRIAREENKYFFDVAKPHMKKAADFILKMYGEQLEYAKEEYRQLEKMYKADEITEETEEIVLRRARNQVDRANFLYENQKLDHEHALKFELPRMEERVKDSISRANLTWEKNRTTLPLALQKQKIEHEKLLVQRQRADDKLTKLLADRAAMTVKAPGDGIVYYGSYERGKWSSSGGDELRRGTTIMANKIFMTVIEPRPMLVRASVPEKQLHSVKPGLQGTAKPTAYPDLRLTTIVESVAGVPQGGSFDARLTVALGPAAEALMPGMTCDVKLTAYEKSDALALPAAAVIVDENDDRQGTIHVLDKAGKPQKRGVKLGKRTAKQIEILSGAAEGDEVLSEPPREKEAATATGAKPKS